MINHKEKHLKMRLDQLETHVHTTMYYLQLYCEICEGEQMPMWHLLPLKKSIDALIRHHKENHPKVKKKTIAKTNLDLETMM